MAGNNSIQFLRGSGTSSSAQLLPGQPYYDYANNKLYIGGSNGTAINAAKAIGNEVTSVNGKTGAVTIKEPTVKYRYNFILQDIRAGSGNTSWTISFSLIAEEADLTTDFQLKQFLKTKLPYEPSTLSCNGISDKGTIMAFCVQSYNNDVLYARTVSTSNFQTNMGTSLLNLGSISSASVFLISKEYIKP